MSFYVEYVLRYGLLLSKNVNFYLWKVKNIIIFGGQKENEQIKQKGGILWKQEMYVVLFYYVKDGWPDGHDGFLERPESSF